MTFFFVIHSFLKFVTHSLLNCLLSYLKQSQINKQQWLKIISKVPIIVKSFVLISRGLLPQVRQKAQRLPSV